MATRDGFAQAEPGIAERGSRHLSNWLTCLATVRRNAPPRLNTLSHGRHVLGAGRGRDLLPMTVSSVRREDI
jgi:hypothetical protein